MENYNTRGFIYNDIMDECKKFKTDEEQLAYLNYVYKEWLNNRPRLDPNGDMYPRIWTKLENEIRTREHLLVLKTNKDLPEYLTDMLHCFMHLIPSQNCTLCAAEIVKTHIDEKLKNMSNVSNKHELLVMPSDTKDKDLAVGGGKLAMYHLKIINDLLTEIDAPDGMKRYYLDMALTSNNTTLGFIELLMKQYNESRREA